jgi:gluconate 5-dehydrogenase
MTLFAGKRALVTGAGSGIGAAVAELLAAEGADVVAADISGTDVHLDVRDEAEVADVARDVDVLVNVAGIGSTTNAPDTPLDVWEDVFAVNARGTFLCCKHAIPSMIARGGGSIVNIASVAGLRGSPPGAMDAIAYNASKGGVISFTRDLAHKWAQHGIRVNAIAPGWFPSDMSKLLLERHGDRFLEGIPLHRFGGPDDLKGAVAFLASPASGYVTGHTLVVDGGQSA